MYRVGSFDRMTHRFREAQTPAAAGADGNA
jgi:hypothetical protein